MGEPRLPRMKAIVPNSRTRGRARSRASPACSISEDVKGETIQRVATPTAMLVGLPEPLGGRAAAVLGGTGLRLLRVGHAAAASERIPVAMPQLVVVTTTLAPAEHELLVDRCVAVGAELLAFAADAELHALSTALLRAASAAVLRSRT